MNTHHVLAAISQETEGEWGAHPPLGDVFRALSETRARPSSSKASLYGSAFRSWTRGRVYVFSAKGASLFQPGATPQEVGDMQAIALKARSIPGGRRSITGTMERAFSPEFRDFASSWGVAPGWNDTAPLALARYRRIQRHPRQVCSPTPV